METLEKRAEDIGKASLRDIRAMSIKTPAYEAKGEESILSVYDMAEYSCDAACDNCHCATY